MCEYQRITHYAGVANLPICTFTNRICTYCVLGNADTYKKAKEAEETFVNDVQYDT